MVDCGWCILDHGDAIGTIQARDAKSGELLWQFQTGFGAEATPMTYEVDGDQYVAIAAVVIRGLAAQMAMLCGPSR